MPGAGKDQDCVSRNDQPYFPVDLDRAFALQQKIEFLTFLMVVSIGCASGGNAGLCEALIENGCVGGIEDASNPRAILGRKGFLAGYVQNNH